MHKLSGRLLSDRFRPRRPSLFWARGVWGGADEHPWVDPKLLHLNHFPKADGEERERLWCRDLMMIAGHFHKLRLTVNFQNFDLHGPSLPPLIGCVGKADENLVKALGLRHRKVELIEDVRGFGAWLPSVY